MHTTLRKVFLILLASSLSAGAMAHTGADAHGHVGFVSGLIHPLTGLDHMAVMVAVGLWSALVARPAGRDMLWAPLGFANALLLGAALGLQGIWSLSVEPLVAASVVVAGLLVVSRLALRGAWAAALVGAFAIFHGMAHGHELAHSADAFGVLAGLLCATALLHAAGLAMGYALRSAPVWLSRTIGSGIALAGAAMVLAQAS